MHESNQGVRSSLRTQGSPEPHRAIFLIGFMGAGKSTVGKELGRLLGWRFEDLDDRITAQEERTVEQIFRESGEPVFRQAEHLALRQLISELESEPRIVALGGGAFIQEDNALLLESTSLTTIFLNAPPEELFRRCEEQGTNRPLRRDRKQFLQLYTSRHSHYLKARYQIETAGKDIPTVATEIGRMLGLLA
jgi:shikimate kinase